jgi:hypothetical protein
MKFFKFFFLLPLLYVFTITQAQIEKAGSVDYSHLKFALKLENTHDVVTKKILIGAKVKIIGTDGSLREFFTDSLGKVSFIEIKPNTSYSIIVSCKGYLNAKGKETSVGETNSKMYVHEYALQPFQNLGCPRFPDIYYSNNGLKPVENIDYDNYKWLYDIMSENPTIIFEVFGYREVSEKKNISIKRAQNFANKVVEMGIDKERFKITDGGIRNYRQPKDTRTKKTKEELKQENRVIIFKVISSDYHSK